VEHRPPSAGRVESIPFDNEESKDAAGESGNLEDDQVLNSLGNPFDGMSLD